MDRYLGELRNMTTPIEQDYALNIRLPVDLIDLLHIFCENNEVQKKKVVELALRRFFTSERGKNVPNDQGPRK